MIVPGPKRKNPNPLYYIVQHLKLMVLVRVLFVDNSSALNTTLPFALYDKLLLFRAEQSLCQWVLDFYNRDVAGGLKVLKDSSLPS